jgi:hypothetical protein
MQTADDEEIQRIYKATRLGKTKVVKEALEQGKITADYADAKVYHLYLPSPLMLLNWMP